MGADRVTALMDSRLATNHVRGELDAIDKRIENYIKAVHRLVEQFKCFTIKHIPQSKNRK